MMSDKLMKYSLLLLVLFGTVGIANAQGSWCGTDEFMENYIQKHPEAKAEFDAEVQRINQLVASRSELSAKSENIMVIPTVFHILHDGCDGNISKSQILDGLRILNEDFRRQNDDASNTRSVFEDHAVDAEIEFRLAKIDPDGNETDGIVRVSSGATNNAGNNVKFISPAWNTSSYMNIWVVNSIQSSGPGITLGYAQFPGFGSWNTYGVVIRNSALGTIGTSNADGRTLTHELGHCFGLFHTFQSGCGGSCSTSGDFVCDTPPVSNSTQGCDGSQNTCTNDNFGPSPYSSNVEDQIENYMSYDACQNMFTKGQKDRMESSILGNVPLVQLTSESNLIATGVGELTAADFTIEDPVIRLADELILHDHSCYGASSWDWTIDGATPSSSTDPNPSVLFTSPGLYSASLVASDGSNTKKVTKSDFVLATTRVGQHLPYIDNMDNSSLPSDSWIATNADADAYAWTYNESAGYSGSGCIQMLNFGSCDRRVDNLYSKTYDLSPYVSAKIKFRLAYSRRELANNDILRVYVSSNNGEDWALQWAFSGSAMETTGAPVTSNFVPTSNADWSQEELEISSQTYLTEGFRFRFEFTSGAGNNLYIDDVEMDGVYKVFPVLESPKNGSLNQASDVLLNWKAVANVDGYEYQIDKVSSFDSPDLITGKTTYISESPLNEDTEFQTSNLEPGVTYFWRVRLENGGGFSDWSTTWLFNVSPNGVGIDEELENSAQLNVFPNPMNDQTSVALDLAVGANVVMEVYDILGKRKVLLSDSFLSSGTHQFQLNKDNLGAGVYIIRAQVDGKKAITQKLLVR